MHTSNADWSSLALEVVGPPTPEVSRITAMEEIFFFLSWFNLFIKT